MTDVMSPPARLAVIATLREALDTWVKAAWPMILLMLLYYGLIFAIVAVLGIVFGVTSMAIGGAIAASGLSFFHWIVVILGVPLFLAITFRFNIAGYRLADEIREGRRPRLIELLRNSRPNLLAFFGLNLLSFILIVVGLLLFIVPGVYIALALSIVLLPMIFEDVRVLDSMKRSVDLTRGNLLRILGVYLIVLLGYLVYAVVISSLEGGDRGEGAITPLMVALIALNAVVSLCFTTFSTMLQVVIYRRLRAMKDGPAQTDVAAPDPSPAP
jgi:MFS family permease